MKHELEIMGKTVLGVGFIILNSLFMIPGESEAFTMTSPTYNLHTDLNSAGGTSSNAQYKANTSVGQTAQGFTEASYSARLGFQYLTNSDSFTVSISQSEIDFGLLTPANPVTRTNTISVSPGSASSYRVVGIQDKPLTASVTNYTIPDTTCDNGSCTTQIAAPWESLLSYGFGYRCDNITGSGCDSGFLTANTFKHFPSSSDKEASIAVMTSQSSTIQSATITYKVNIATTQPAGQYSNTITFIATPAF